MLLLVVVLLTGQEVHLNPNEIVALIQAREHADPLKHYAPEVRCVVETTGRHEYTTQEECVSIERRLDDLKARRRQ